MGAYSGEGGYCKLSALTWGLIRAGGLIERRGLNRGFTVLNILIRGLSTNYAKRVLCR